MNTRLACALTGALLLGPLTAAVAETSAAPRPAEGRPFGPPPEAYQACTGKTVGSRAEFTGPHGHAIAGTCQDDGSGKIVLRPDHPPGGGPGGHRGPPPEAYSVCVGKTAGSTAQLTTPHGEILQGTCELQPARLVFRPNQPPTPPAGAPAPAE